MPHTDINFEAIRAYEGSRHAGFEELCCQLASLECDTSAAKYFRKGRGGDAGVECFIRTPDGKETGWQAKYVFGWNSALASQLDTSIKAALAKHPKLVRYIVCLPFDLSDARTGKAQSALQRWETWRAKWIKQAKSKKRKLQLDLWTKSNLVERLTRDGAAYAGRLAYWFEQVSYSPEWLRQQFGKSCATLGSRYTPETNVELPIRRNFLGFTRDPSLNIILRDLLVNVQEEANSAVKALRDFQKTKPSCQKPLEDALESLVESFACLPVPPNQSFPLSHWGDASAQLRSAIREAQRWLYDQQEKKTTGRMGIRTKEWAEHCLFKLSDALQCLDNELGTDRWTLANRHATLLTGGAGTGKSHLLADVVGHHIATGFPSVLLVGSAFIDADPWRQVLTQLDLPVTLQTSHFLAAMDSAAEAAGVRAIICIDAINERNGIDVWPTRLAAFLKEAEPFPRVAVVLSCRSTYLPFIVPSDLPETALPRIEHVGFSGRASEAARVYLDKRGIVRPGAPNLVPEFENPLFLKTCCDFLEKEGRREIPKGLTGVSQIFGFYVDAVAQVLDRRMQLDSHARVVPRAVRALAEEIGKGETGYVAKSTAITLFERIHPSNNAFEQSLLSQLEREGTIAIEAVQQDDGSREDQVRFTFERFSDYQIAETLLARHLNPQDVSNSFASGTVLHGIVNGPEAYRRSGLIEALSVLLPERVGAELLDLIPDTSNHWLLDEPFRESLHWRDQRHFTDRTFELLKSVAGSDELTDILFALTTEPKNKFNALFLHDCLSAIPLAERDERWTSFINGRGDYENSSLNTLIAWTFANGLGEVDDDRAELAGIALSWLLTASHRAVRDKATKALACLLSRRLKLAAALVERFAAVDDVYIFERVLAASYGAVLQGMASEGVAELAIAAFEHVFANGVPPANLLLRDHAWGILQCLQRRGELPPEVDATKAAPPYRSAWPLEYVPDELIETYKQDYGKDRYSDSIVSSCVNDGDFARHQIDPLVRHWTMADISVSHPPTYEEMGMSWLKEFSGWGTNDQLEAFNHVLEAVEALRGEFHSYQDTPETRRLKDRERAFRQTLSSDEWERYRVTAQSFVNYTLYTEHRGRIDSVATFDRGWARRWICKRAHEYGWTPERFAGIERIQRGHDGRMDHRVERIGEKYQWCATNEFAARLADHLAFKSEAWSGKVETQHYEGAWQVGLRDIDPSLLVSATHYDGWREWPRTWWVPVAPTLHKTSREERLTWRDTEQDIINEASLIEVTEPQSGRRWLALDGFAGWHERGIEDGRSELQRRTWFRLRCVVAKRAHRAKLLKWLRTERLTAPDDLPEIKLYGDNYLGEYPWHPSLVSLDAWHEPDQWRKTPVPIRATVANYSRERSGCDYSIDSTISVSIPAPWLMNALDLRLCNGRRLHYVAADGSVMFFDPSVSAPGPHAALIDRDAFLTLLQKLDLCALWVIAGEKDVYSGSSSGLGWGGRLAHSFVYEMKGDKFACYKRIDIERPNAEQLRAYLDGDARIAKKKKIASKP